MRMWRSELKTKNMLHNKCNHYLFKHKEQKSFCSTVLPHLSAGFFIHLQNGHTCENNLNQ